MGREFYQAFYKVILKSFWDVNFKSIKYCESFVDVGWLVVASVYLHRFLLLDLTRLLKCNLLVDGDDRAKRIEVS